MKRLSPRIHVMQSAQEESPCNKHAPVHGQSIYR